MFTFAQPQHPLLMLLFLGLLCEAAVLGAVFCYCLRRLRRRHQARLQRHAAREHLAASLHDTLLQSMQGLLLRFQSVGQRLPADSQAHAAIDNILDQADALLADSREQIQALRMPELRGDELSQAFAALGHALRDSFGTPFRMVVTAEAVPLGAAAEQVYRIGREALYNAFQHAQASLVELELVYGCEAFTLYVRDNGKGMAEVGAAAGTWRGLHASRIQAETLGGSIEVLTQPARGTEVILRLPCALCYPSPRAGWRRRLAAWLGRTEAPR